MEDLTLGRFTSPGNDGEDLVLETFLSFLARDMANHPERLQAADTGLVLRLQSLVEDIEVNLDEALSDDE